MTTMMSRVADRTPAATTSDQQRQRARRKSVETAVEVGDGDSDETSSSTVCLRCWLTVAGIMLTFGSLLSALFLLVIYPHIVRTQQPDDSSGTQASKTAAYKWPAPSNSLLGEFRRAAVTTDHGLCSEIGRDVLLAGGNAADSAVATMACLGVTNPQSSGLGGGFIATFYDKKLGKCVSLDARETAPAAATRDMFVGKSDDSKYGFRAMGVPGELAGYWHLYKKYGSGNVVWRDLLMPAARLARAVPVSEYLAATMKAKERHFRVFPSVKYWMDWARNDTFQWGDILHRDKLADTLELLANSSEPAELFYRGQMARTMAQEIQDGGGIITYDDFAGYQVREHTNTTLVNDHFKEGLAMCGPPPPSSFTVVQLIVSLMSGLYPNGGSKNELYGEPLFYHRYIESMKYGYAQRTLLGDSAFVASAAELARNLTTKLYTDQILAKFTDTAQPSEYYGGDATAQRESHGTSHVSVLDAQGNALAATTTINRWFGAAVESSRYGILWNDEMDDFSTPGTANGFGFAPSETNFIEPGKRPMSTMAPMVMYDKDTKDVRMVIGASGGSKIISALTKAVLRVLLFDESLKEAIDSPMLHNQFTPDITQIDDNFPPELRALLETRYGQKFRNTTGFEGIVQGIVVAPKNGFVYASGDWRRKTNQHAEGF